MQTHDDARSQNIRGKNVRIALNMKLKISKEQKYRSMAAKRTPINRLSYIVGLCDYGTSLSRWLFREQSSMINVFKKSLRLVMQISLFLLFFSSFFLLDVTEPLRHETTACWNYVAWDVSFHSNPKVWIDLDNSKPFNGFWRSCWLAPIVQMKN